MTESCSEKAKGLKCYKNTAYKKKTLLKYFPKNFAKYFRATIRYVTQVSSFFCDIDNAI